MPRTKKFGTRLNVAHLRTKEGKFSKCEANLKPSIEMPGTVVNIGVSFGDPMEHERIDKGEANVQHWNNTAHTNIGVSFGDPMEHERIDESRCYVCGSEEGCALCVQTHYNLCSQCQNSNPTQG